MTEIAKIWKHPGGKFRRLGPSSCSEKELLAIIIGSGSRGRSADKIAEELVDKYGTSLNLSGLTLRQLMETKGLKEVKATQLAAIFELTRRIIKHIERK